MNAKELRIGNYAIKLGYPHRVKAHDIGVTANDGKIDYLNPIPLTPEILEKCGFEKSEPIGWYSKKPTPLSQSMDLFSPKVNLDELHYADGAFSPELKYLHQLQNLYFALTGQELEVNL